MKIDDFRQMVRAEFGDGLQHATPANVREFLDRVEVEELANNTANRIVINDQCGTYEEVIKDFFYHILELPAENAVLALWTLALDLAYSTIEQQQADRLAALFQDYD